MCHYPTATLHPPQFEPHDLKCSPELRHTAAAARRNMMHIVATAFVSYAPNAQLPIPLAAALLACTKMGYGWGNGGDAGAEAEIPLAATALKRLGELADTPSGLRDPPRDHDMFYNVWDTHLYLWEAIAAAPPAVAAAHARLLDASIKTVVDKSFRGGLSLKDTFRLLKALAQLHPLVQDAGPLARYLVLDLGQSRKSLSDEQLCEAVAHVGELLLNAPTVRRALMPTAGHVFYTVGELVDEAMMRMEVTVRRRAGDDAESLRIISGRHPADTEIDLKTRDVLRLLQGFPMISEACSVISTPGSSSGGGGGSGDDSSGGSGGGSGDRDVYRYGIEPAQDVALRAAAAGQDVASALVEGVQGARTSRPVRRGCTARADRVRHRPLLPHPGDRRQSAQDIPQVCHPDRLGAAVARPGPGQAPPGRRARTVYGSGDD